MVRTLELAIEALKTLPAADQERLGRQLAFYVEKLLQLRVEIDWGIGVLEREAAVALDVDEFLVQQNARRDQT